MEQVDFIKDFKRVCVAFNKPFGQEECEIYYDMLKEYKKTHFKIACDLAIKECKFFPKVAEMLEFCKRASIESKKIIVNYMISKGYFKCDTEIKKTLYFVEHNIIPNWLKDDMRKYYKMMLNENNTQKIESQDGLLLN